MQLALENLSHFLYEQKSEPQPHHFDEAGA
jgi:hypothetical protein